MARYQYRVQGTLGWMSNSGNALLAISNPLGSGKKLTIRSLEIHPAGSNTTTSAGSISGVTATKFAVARATVSGGELLTMTKMDSNASDWPSTVRVTTLAAVSSVSTVSASAVQKQMNWTNPLGWGSMQSASKGWFCGAWRMPRKHAGGEGIVIRAGEGAALYCSTLNHSFPVRVCATVVRSGSPNRTYQTSAFVSLQAVDVALFAIENQSGSGETVTLRDIRIEEVGTLDSPYFQVVPVGALMEPENSTALSILKMDSNYPDPSSWIKAYSDVAMLPFGMPENALADSSSGSPKGFNYLKTKDFLGPVYRTLFPEMVTRLPNVATDFIPTGMKWHDQMMRSAGITVREGEGIALVSGAETAAGAASAVTASGWNTFLLAATIDVEPKISPTLTITGLQNPSEVRIYDAGTTTELAGQEDITTGSFSWVFDPDSYPEVDIAILSLGYQNIRFAAFPLTLADTSIPVQQQIDRQYANP